MSDIRYALRQLVRQPGFAITVALTLALGIGATTAVFSAVNTVLLRPLPYPEADRLVRVWESHPDWSERNVVSSGSYLDWRDRATAFDALGAHSHLFSVGITGDAAPDHIFGAWITPNLLELLGTQPALGRTFATERPADNASQVVVSHALWQGRFGGDSSIVGRTVFLEEQPATVIGVLPRAFDFPTPSADFWLPLRFDAEDRDARRSHRWTVVGRLAEGTSADQAQAEMDLLVDQMRLEHPQWLAGWSARVIPYRADEVRDIRPTLLILFGVVVLVLLVACANVANLLLARAVTREQEMAVRGALGADRPRLARQLVVEGLVLATLGGGLGFLLAYWGVDVLRATAPTAIPFLGDASLDPRVLGFAVLATIGATLLFAVVPALRLSGTDMRTVLQRGHGGIGGTRHGRLRRLLLVGQVALALVVATGAGLLVRSLIELRAVDPGIETERLLAVSIDLPYGRYDGTTEQEAFYAQLLERVRALPGVQAATGTPEPPVVGFNNTFSYLIEGKPPTGPDPREDPVEVRAVTGDYFRTTGIPVRAGRAIADTDRTGTQLVAVVNESLAREHWPDGDAVGQRFTFDDEGQGPWIEIVGVAGDTRHYGQESEVQPAIYLPYGQKRWNWMSWLTLLVRTDADPMAVAPLVRDAVWQLDDRLPIRRLAPVSDLYAARTAERRFVTALLLSFALLAVVIGVVGIYGVTAYAVGQRRREIGLRMAMGAHARSVAGTVLREGLGVTTAGVALGLVIALAATRVLAGLLYGISPHDPVTLAAVAGVLVLAALLASWIPAHRATRISPMEALRHE